MSGGDRKYTVPDKGKQYISCYYIWREVTAKRDGGNHFFQDQENGLLILGVKELEKGKYMVLINTVAGEAERFSCRAQYGAALENR